MATTTAGKALALYPNLADPGVLVKAVINTSKHRALANKPTIGRRRKEKRELVFL
eukprot:CAMPEP_0206409288 /NCGR_PEP_ID=MMETSP0294-20121207/31751_1 /ASSEMBLY_ACC=CAM_ASM_000327 /TAXON_ID=39354 /ORGANISM="Heterosigma akashiwo, Strain CCMP2393" /LENGTH=54 /DNA_ID=CAMNT_0053869101 /DNA_START=55 /DNA_END=216 /DNA_ORIENTATION=+